MYFSKGYVGIIRSAPYNFPCAGGVSNGSLNSVGSRGYYWSRTAFSNDGGLWEPDVIDEGVNSLYIASSNVNPSAYGEGRYYGFSVRCVATT